MANEEYKQNTLRGGWERWNLCGMAPSPGYTGKSEDRLGGFQPGEEGQGPGLHGNRGGGLDTHPHGNGGGVGSLGDRTGVSTGKCFRREPKSRAPRKVPGPGRV